jgi:hypothetical protein
MTASIPGKDWKFLENDPQYSNLIKKVGVRLVAATHLSYSIVNYSSG